MLFLLHSLEATHPFAHALYLCGHFKRKKVRESGNSYNLEEHLLQTEKVSQKFVLIEVTCLL